MKPGKRYLLFLLTVILAFNYTDRFALGMVLEDLKRDLLLTDSQLGLLSGIAFALFYSLMGLPIARLADRENRVTLIAVTAALWGVAVAVCGVATSFLHLLLIRVGIGIGESGCVPPSLSLITEYFSREERPRAVSAYMQGISLSFFIGYLAAGWINELFGWRVMFLLIGLPGLALSVLTATTLKDPRPRVPRSSTILLSHRSLLSTSKSLWNITTFRRLLYSCAVNWFFTYGTLQWAPAFFERSFGTSSGILGTIFALIFGVSSIAGTYLGGAFATRYAAKNEALQLRGMAVVTCVSGVLMLFVYLKSLSPNTYLAFTWLGLSNLAASMVNGPQFAVLQTVIPPPMRATSTALVYLFGNLIGIGLGPWGAGALSDALGPWLHQDSLRYAMAILCPGFIWSAYYLWEAAKTASCDLEAAQWHAQLTSDTTPPQSDHPEMRAGLPL